MKSGFVTILGKPNVGKSTLLNQIMGEKVAIVSPKPQTTRNKILGILNEPDYQIIFIDTPGKHNVKNKLDKFMDSEIAIGRKTDFLIQEFNREANTIGSKAQDVEIARRVVAIKAEIEKIREQIQNIE